jgi:pimeloyl-ACP methyl ester carboxylesterase
MADIAYRTADVDGLTVFYREAGERFRIVAPDLPGFGKSDMPPRDDFDYTFQHLADVIDRRTELLRTSRPRLLAVWGSNDPFFFGAEPWD